MLETLQICMFKIQKHGRFIYSKGHKTFIKDKHKYNHIEILVTCEETIISLTKKDGSKRHILNK